MKTKSPQHKRIKPSEITTLVSRLIEKYCINKGPGVKPPVRTFSSGDPELKPTKLYMDFFGYAPNTVDLSSVAIEGAVKTFIELHKQEIRTCLYSEGISKEDYDKGTVNPHQYTFILEADLLVHFDDDYNEIAIMYFKTNIAKVYEIINELAPYFETEEEVPEIHLLVSSSHGISTRRMELSPPQLDIASNYNDDFLPVHEIIEGRLSQENDKGLVLLHGKPGTGKTSYLRFLATSLKKKIIFLPPDMAGAIADPNFISVLMDNRNSILIIEDAEKVIVDRETSGYSPVSTLLNLADGLLSDCLNIQIICSFNTDLSHVDKALMRKGRLIARYEFKALETPKAQALSEKLGFDTIISTSMTLTDIYNQDEQAFEQGNRMAQVGFNLGKTG